MNILNQLKKALHEADRNNFLSDRFETDTAISFQGEMAYTGDSRIELQLSYELPSQTKKLVSTSTFDSISEDQFKSAADKIKSALEKVSEEFELSLKNKLSAYGLEIEGENQNG